MTHTQTVTFRCRAVLLDMDGTLVDSTAAVQAQWARWGQRHGVALADILAISHGVPALETMRVLAPHAATAEEHARFMAEEEAHEGGVVAVPGALRFVSALPPGRWAVVTSAPRGLALRRLTAAGFPDPPVLVAADEVDRGKPDPLPYLLAARRLGVDARDSVAVEDAPAGIESARSAGATVIALTTTFPPDRLDCPAKVPDFESLAVSRDGDSLVVRAQVLTRTI